MNKYFTKEYIKECDCEEIQRLKAKRGSSIAKIALGDWYFNRATKEISLFTYGTGEGLYPTWLPTSDQLDDRIVDRINNGENYSSCYCKATDSFVAFVEPDELPDASFDAFYGDSFVLAKIRLLKELLNEN